MLAGRPGCSSCSRGPAACSWSPSRCSRCGSWWAPASTRTRSPRLRQHPAAERAVRRQLPDPVRPGLRLLPGAGAQPAALAGHDGGQPAGGQPRGVRPGAAAGATPRPAARRDAGVRVLPRRRGAAADEPVLRRRRPAGHPLVGIGIAQLSFTVPLAVWFLAYAFRQVPNEVEEAARVDGAGVVSIIARIIVPVARPGVAGTTVLVFVASWNDYVFSSNLNRSTRSETLPVLLAKLPTIGFLGGQMAAVGAGVPAGRARHRGAAALAGRPLPLTRRTGPRRARAAGLRAGAPVRRLACRSLKSCRGHTDVRAGWRPSCPSPWSAVCWRSCCCGCCSWRSRPVRTRAAS